MELFDTNNLDIKDVIKRIVNLNNGLRKFWKKPHGWAPLEAAELLNRSRLDWQVSLSKCLFLWVNNFAENDKDGNLILAWTNLGSLVEGTLKLFLSVYYTTYLEDINAIRRKEKVIDPDGLQLETLRIFFKKRIWDKRWNWDDWLQHIQQRRNAIHAFKERDLGNFTEFYEDVRIYLRLLRKINERLPYADEIYIPREF